MLAVTISKVLTPFQPADLISPLSDSPAPETASPAMVVKGANRFFSSTARSDQYFTAVYGIIDTAQRKITLAQAGLPQPVFLRGDGDASAVGQGGFPIGLMDGVDYADEVILYNPGDRIFLYSDGIIECFNGKTEQFSIDRLMTVLQEGRHTSLKASLNTLEQSLFAWRGGKEFDDDLTMLAIEFEV